MGSTSYNFEDRSTRSFNSGFKTKSRDEIFTQSKERKVHESMDSRKVTIRECRDSEAHPATIPIILALDVTGSMGHIPHHLIVDGLPKLMGNLIQKGAKDASLLFLAIGDHEADRHPLQVGQFESGDAELDMWLTRTYPESGGGGNIGESYSLAWYFAANHVVTDAYEKRGKLGFLFTVGDEPCLNTIPASAIREIIPAGTAQASLSSAELLELAKKRFHVYHLHITHSEGSRRSLGYWKELMGENCIEVPNYQDIPDVLSKIVLNVSGYNTTIPRANTIPDNDVENNPSSEEML